MAIPARDWVTFSHDGQVEIPADMRRQLEIQPGTKAFVEITPQGILIRPVTREAINELRGAIPRGPDEPPMSEWWAKYQEEERQLESRGLDRP